MAVSMGLQPTHRVVLARGPVIQQQCCWAVRFRRGVLGQWLGWSDALPSVAADKWLCLWPRLRPASVKGNRSRSLGGGVRCDVWPDAFL